MKQEIKAHPQLVAELAAQGHSQATIAMMLGVSRERIRQICGREGIETLPGHRNWDALDRAREIVASGEAMTVDDLAKRLGLSTYTPHNWIKQGLLSRPKAPPRQWHVMRDCAARGMSLSETARFMGIAVQNVWTQSSAHGITYTKKDKCGRPAAGKTAAE